ncbi:MAG: MFS transporter [Bacteroidetes bacterium]|nr:MFS transporter [Bacteroidota bacterium]
MKKTRFLTDEEKVVGGKYLTQFQSLNGMGFSFLGDTPVYLLAIMYGATNVQLGYISSALFLSGIIIPLLPKMLAGKNLIKVQSMAWLLRGIVCLGYLLLYFLQGQPAVYLILLLYTVFSIVRTVGVIMFKPVLRMITTNTNQGEVVGKITFGFQVSAILSKTVSFLVTAIERFSGAAGIIGLQMCGVIVNTLAALRVRKVPCRETIEYKKGRGMLVQLRDSFRSKEIRRVLILQWLFTAITVMVGLTIPFLRNRTGLSTSGIFLYSMGMTLASIFSAMFVRTFGDKIGSKPLMVFGSFVVTVLILCWAVAPETLPISVYFVMGFLVIFMININNMLISRLIIKRMPEKEAVGFSSMVQFIIAIISLVLGVVGGRLIDFGPVGAATLLNQYSWTFFLAAGLSLISFIITLRVTDSESLSGKDAASILLSIYGLRAYLNINRLQKIEDPVRKKTVLLSIGSNHNDVATSEIKRMLHSPFSSEKAEIIRSLFYHPRPSLLPLLLKDASDEGSYTQESSIFALGAFPGKETEELLLAQLDSGDAAIRTSAAKSLGRIGHTASLDRIRKLFMKETDTRCLMNYFIALKNMDKEGAYLLELFSIRWAGKTQSFRQGIYSLNAEFMHYKPELSHLFQLSNGHKGAGVRDFLDETRDHSGFLTSHQDLIRWFKEEDFSPIIAFCRKVLDGCGPDSIRINIKNSIINRIDESVVMKYDDVLAMLYFTYQIVKPE